eukprot:TRINITY_DN27138_c0_g1_i1.p1 TRINITY_DN27138_c0_g1~~TRINITY_DN27138_c0_g1_i1.p1  ORF type:complete len:263 (-),score=82.03 TRINITY_DN27138_c0_g1_i1:97-885(-)
MGSGDNDDSKGEEPVAALVEVRNGLKTRKWSLQLGQKYMVGKAGGSGLADIDVDHPSISRRHCELAVTRLPSEADEGEGDLIFVAMDGGSTNGTFINKKRMEKGVGIKMRLAEVKYLMFGECENGYQILVRSDEKAPAPEKRAAASGVSRRERRRQKAEVDADRVDDQFRELDDEDDGVQRAPDGSITTPYRSERSRSPGQKDKERRLADEKKARERQADPAKRQQASSSDKSKSKWRTKVKETSAEAKAAAADIEWPEDWR